jgi:MFS family permease
MLIGIIGMIVFVASPLTATSLRYGFIHIALIGAGSANPLVAAWLTDNTPDKATRAIFMGFFGWSNIAGIIAGQVYKKKYAPSYKIPIVITLAIVAVGMIGFLAVRITFMIENKKRKRTISGWMEEDFEAERRDATRRGHMKRFFVYGY